MSSGLAVVLLIIPLHPLWAITVIVIDILVIWALTVRGPEMKTY